MKKVHLIGNAHIDPVWLWRWQEGFAEIKATFRSALDRMDEYPDFVFTSACASYYKWVEENCPEMFAEIKKRVGEGRWDVSGGWWLQPDCNIPSGESFARHALYSQRYFLDRFGITATVGYNVDSFGHNGMLPQILRKSGIDHYVFMRPSDFEKELPASAFLWESPDGSRVTAYRIPNGYNNDLKEERVLERMSKVSDTGENQGIPMMFFYGVGNHGGGPTRAIIELFMKLMKDGNDSLCFSRTDSYFRELASCGTELPVVREDLQHHASGCYSTTSKIKALNRKAETRIQNAEKYACIASSLLGTGYDGKRLQTAWEDVLFNQFHDIMGGCSIKPAYDDAEEFYGEALKISGDILNSALQKISWAVDTHSDADPAAAKSLEDTYEAMNSADFPLVVFNMNARAAVYPISTDDSARITDESGNTVESQRIRAAKTDRHRKWDTLFMASLPALGYRVYRRSMAGGDSPVEPEPTLSAAADRLENAWYSISFDKSTGWIDSIYDKKNQREVLSGPGAVPVVLDDSGSDTWAHGITSFRKEIARFADASLTLIEEGPLRATIRVMSGFGHSSLQQDFSLYRDIPEIHVKVRLNWQESRKILKLSYPVNINEGRAVYEIPYGCIEKAADGREEAGHSWFAVCGRTECGEEAGFAIANDSKYSYDILGSEMRMTVVRSAFYADHFGEHDIYNEPMDIGIQYLEYKLIPFMGRHAGACLTEKAIKLVNPPVVIPETFHKGMLPLEKSFLSVDAENITVHALKMSEDGDGAIIRCVETAGIETNALVSFGPEDIVWETCFSPYEIKTFRISDRRASETDLLEFAIGGKE